LPHRADARDHLRAAERLDDVVVGAELKPHDAIGLGPMGRQHHDRDISPAAQRPAHLASVAVRQVQVEQHEVGLDLRRGRERLGGGPHRRRLEAGAVQRLREGHRDRRLVLDEQDARAGAFRHGGAG
jgi:hypothetical protein